MGTGGIKALVVDVMNSLPAPHTEDVIDDVFQAIEKRPEWRKRYDDLVAAHSKTTVNTFAGWWIARLEERSGEQKVPAKNSLTGVYSKLSGGAKKRTDKRLTKDAAREIMAAYYKKHKDSLPDSIRQRRPLLLEFIEDGLPVEEAFAKAIEAERSA